MAPVFATTFSSPQISRLADRCRQRTLAHEDSLEAKEGDEDLIEYYYIVLHPQTMTGFEYRRSVGKKFWRETRTRLMERFGDNCPGLYIPEKE